MPTTASQPPKCDFIDEDGTERDGIRARLLVIGTQSPLVGQEAEGNAALNASLFAVISVTPWGSAFG